MQIQRASEWRKNKNRFKKFWLFPTPAALERSGYAHQWNWLWWNFQWNDIGTHPFREQDCFVCELQRLLKQSETKYREAIQLYCDE